MNKKSLIKIKDGNRMLYYKSLPKTRFDGVSATLVGYRKNGSDHWY